MSDESVVHLLVVDRSLSDIERLTQLMRGAGYVVQTTHAADEKGVTDRLWEGPTDMVFVRVDEGLPGVKKIVGLLRKAEVVAPVIAIADSASGTSQVEVMRAGGDNLVLLDNPEQVILVAGKELRQSRKYREAMVAANRLRELEERSRLLLDTSRDAIAYIHEGAHIYANPVYLRLFGYAHESDLEGVTLMNMVTRDCRDSLKAYLRSSMKAGEPQPPVELTGLHSNGQTTFPVSLVCLPTQIDREPCLQIVVRSESGTTANADVLEQMARTDIATGLHNRRGFIDHLQKVRDGAGRERAGAVFYMLLTDYRANNEAMGLAAVDQMVVNLARALREIAPPDAMLARFSDAVFTLYTPHNEAAAQQALAESMRDGIRDHVSQVDGRLVSTGCAIGICEVAADMGSAFQIIGNADQACDKARRAGNNLIESFAPPKPETGETDDDKANAQHIADAITSERMELWFQPIASFQDSTRERYEMFLELRGNDGRLLDLDRLLPLATRRGLMFPLEKWLIVRGLEMLVQRYQEGQTPCTLFVPVTGNTLAAGDFSTWLQNHIRDTGLSGDVLVLEVAEAVLEQYFKEANRLRARMKEIGSGFAISHFGGKTNSERLLRHLQPDYVKIDGALIEKLGGARDAASREKLAHLTKLARELDTEVVAAEIATAPQMASIWQFGVGLVQGDMVQAPSREMSFDFKQFAA